MLAYFSANLMSSKENYHSTESNAKQKKKSSAQRLRYGSSFPHPVPPTAVKAQPSSTAGFRCTTEVTEATNTSSGKKTKKRHASMSKTIAKQQEKNIK